MQVFTMPETARRLIEAIPDVEEPSPIPTLPMMSEAARRAFEAIPEQEETSPIPTLPRFVISETARRLIESIPQPGKDNPTSPRISEESREQIEMK